MTWAEAWAALLEGKAVRRAGWGNYQWFLAQSYFFGNHTLTDSQSNIVAPLRADLKATDWEVIPNEPTT